MLAACTSKEAMILEMEQLDIPSPFSNKTETYKILYQSDEYTVTGFVIKPENIQEKAPVLLFNRGGNRDYMAINDNALKYLSFWADKGFVVLASQYRGNDGGEGIEDFGGEDVNDVLNLAKAAKELNYADTNNMVMLGASRGGLMTYQSIKQGINIKAAATIGGISNLFEFYSNREQSLKNVLTELVGDPEVKHEEYRKRSAIYWTEKLNVPLLIMHGSNDSKVSIDQARNLRDKLKDNDKEYKFVEYPGGNHGLTTHFDEYTTETLNWFNKYLD